MYRFFFWNFFRVVYMLSYALTSFASIDGDTSCTTSRTSICGEAYESR